MSSIGNEILNHFTVTLKVPFIMQPWHYGDLFMYEGNMCFLCEDQRFSHEISLGISLVFM